MKITLISGTNRPGSYTRKVTQYIHNQLKTSSPSLEIELLDLTELPPELFLPQAYEKKPASFDRFKNAVLQTDGIFSVIPEYNGGPAGVFKYFIDMLPFPQSLQKKPCAFVGVADGRFGNLRGIEQIMQIFAYRNAYIFSERTFITHVTQTFDSESGPKDEMIKKVMQNQITGFVDFVSRLK